MYINNKLPEAEYTKCVIECTKEVNRLNPSTKNNQLDKSKPFFAPKKYFKSVWPTLRIMGGTQTIVVTR
jgi:hypothetical protein